MKFEFNQDQCTALVAACSDAISAVLDNWTAEDAEHLEAHVAKLQALREEFRLGASIPEPDPIVIELPDEVQG